MSSRWARVFAPLLLLMLTAGTTLEQSPAGNNGRVLFVKGHIDSAEYIGGLAQDGDTGSEPFVDGADYRVKLAVDEVLAGHTHEPDLYLTLTITGAPPGEAHPAIFLLVKPDADGQFEPIAWDYVSDGICVDDDTAKAYGLEALLPALEKKYPCQPPL